MIADRRTDATIQSNMQGERIALKVNEFAMQHIMQAMTDLYKDRILAFIREISTNALDAQVENGYAGPIEVSTPGPLAPFFKVKDRGCGLSVDDIHNIYSQYGASTKRGTNDQVGMLGFGCKSPLAYTSQFTLTSVKDGVKISVMITRDEQGAGHMQIIDTVSTSEHSGTEIIIPVRSHDTAEVERKAQTFFSYWKPGTVLLNGAQPERFAGLKITDNLWLTRKDQSAQEHHVVMGNVAYPVSKYDDALDNSLTRMAWGYSLVYRVEIGEVEFTPSREALKSPSPKNTAVLKRMAAEWAANAESAFRRLVDEAPTPFEAIKTYRENYSAFPILGGIVRFTHKGRAIPETSNEPIKAIPARQRPFNACHYSPQGIQSVSWDRYWIVGYDLDKWTISHRKKLNKYMEDNGLEVPQDGFAASLKLPAAVKGWIPQDRILQWADIKAVKLPRPVSTGVTVTGQNSMVGKYEISTPDMRAFTATPASEIDTTRPLFWVAENLSHLRTNPVRWKHQDATIVRLPANRIQKFCRLFPAAAEADDALILKIMQEFRASLSKDERDGLALGSYRHMSTRRALRGIDPRKVKDPAVKRAVRLLTLDLTEQERLANLLGVDVSMFAFENPTDSYPLFQPLNGRNDDHVYSYMNWVYEAQKEA